MVDDLASSAVVAWQESLLTDRDLTRLHLLVVNLAAGSHEERSRKARRDEKSAWVGSVAQEGLGKRRHWGDCTEVVVLACDYVRRCGSCIG